MKRAIVDLSSFVWSSLLYGEDKEFGYISRNEDGSPRLDKKGREQIVNTAAHGYEGAVQGIFDALDDLRIQPRDAILVKEGMNSKAERTALYPEYKAGRDKLPEQYVEFQKCLQMVIDNFQGIGAQLAWQDGGVESDDVMGYLALNLEGDRYVISSDKDMAALVDIEKGIHHWRMGVLDKNPFGDFPHSMIPVYLSLVGDSGDKIPGAVGFGATAWLKMMTIWGNNCLPLMLDLIKNRELHRLKEDLPQLKELQKIIDGADLVYTSYELARLRIDRINTLKRPLQWKAGMVKPRDQFEDRRFHKHAGVVRLITAEVYDDAKVWAFKQIQQSPYVALDIETSTPEESDAWLERLDKSEDKTPVDVFGSELTGMSLTFGPNMQYTVYLTHDHLAEPGYSNLTIEQVRDFVGMVPRRLITYVHNASFELPVCFMEWGKDWESDPEYHGFLRNVRDTLIGASYVDENQSKGLKSQSKNVLGYEQENYQQVTTLKYLPADQWGGTGKEVSRGEDEVNGELIPYVVVQHKMNQLTARHVLNYGADDTICTAALANFQRIIMEIEKTWSVYEEVETFPAYLTALAFVQGIDFSLETMREMEKADDEAYDKAWVVLRDYLLKIGYEGTVCPLMVREDRYKAMEAECKALDQDLPSHILPWTPAGWKEAWKHIVGREITFKVRNADKVAKVMRQVCEDELVDDDQRMPAGLLATAIDHDQIGHVNELLQRYFVGEPRIDLNSPKQVAHLLYDKLGLPVNLTNDVTPIEYAHNRPLADAIREHKKWRRGKVSELSDETWALVRKKAKANDDAIDYALAFDSDYLDDEIRAALKALGAMKKVMTRRQLFYKNYWNLIHWKDGKLHPSINQCAAVTRRYSGSNPNPQQWPKKGEAVQFRASVKPHHKDAVVISEDYTGQELRLAAEVSQDKNMLACYIGEKKKDIHSITAAGAMKLKWGNAVVEQLFVEYGDDLPRTAEGAYDLFVRIHKSLGKDNPVNKRADDLRKDSKNVNFGAQNGAMDLKLSETLIMRPSDAQLFLDARSDMFPDVKKAADAAEAECKKFGYVTTLMGARRHLREAIASDDKAVSSRAARQAWNFKIQGSAGEMTKLGMGRLWKSGVLHRLDVRFMVPVHDELIASAHKDHAVEFAKVMHDCMVGPYSNMKVPILSSISLGPDLKNQHEAGDWFIEDSVKAILRRIFSEPEARAV